MHSFELASRPLPLSFGIAHRGADTLRLVVEGGRKEELLATSEREVTFQHDRGVTVYVELSPGARDAGVSPVMDARVELDATTLLDARMVEIVDAGKDANVVRMCPSENSCTREEYPCEPSTLSGYTCQGQLAEWPMPSDGPGAKVAPSYDVKTLEGVTIDRATGLLWERRPPATYPGCSGNKEQAGDLCTFAEAEAYCDQLTLANMRWRLPSKIELESLLSETRLAPAIDQAAFPAARYAPVFARSFLEPDLPYIVEFASGGTRPLVPKDQGFGSVRCVHDVFSIAGTPAQRYRSDADSGVVTDTRTTLVWQRSPSAAEMASGDDASAYCASLGQGNRLPTRKELLTLYDPAATRPPALDAMFFPDAPEPDSYVVTYFWTASPYLLKANGGNWLVEFFAGMTMDLTSAQDGLMMIDPPGTLSLRAWCVR